MWDDEVAPWDISSTEAPAEGDAAEGAPAEAAAVEKPVLKLEKLEPPHYNHHWVRPLFLNYAYLYDYRWDDMRVYLRGPLIMPRFKRILHVRFLPPERITTTT